MPIINIGRNDEGEAYAYMIEAMREYQKNNNITKECMQNALYLWIQFEGIIKNIKIKASIVIGDDEINKRTMIVPNHVILILNDIVIDPSWETFSLTNKRYYTNTHDFLEYIENEKELVNMFKSNVKLFKKTEKRINGIVKGIYEPLLTEYYKNQAEYVIKAVKSKFS